MQLLLRDTGLVSMGPAHEPGLVGAKCTRTEVDWSCQGLRHSLRSLLQPSWLTKILKSSGNGVAVLLLVSLNLARPW